jgi:hypothetical protein
LYSTMGELIENAVDRRATGGAAACGDKTKPCETAHVAERLAEARVLLSEAQALRIELHDRLGREMLDLEAEMNEVEAVQKTSGGSC